MARYNLGSRPRGQEPARAPSIESSVKAYNFSANLPCGRQDATLAIVAALSAAGHRLRVADDTPASASRCSRSGGGDLIPHKYGNTFSRMKTTVDLPDELFIAAKKRAAELRQPLRALIERGLRAELGRGASRRKAERRTIRWVTVAGGLPPGVNVADRAAMYDWLRQQR